MTFDFNSLVIESLGEVQPDLFVTTPSLLTLIKRVMRTKVLHEVGNYIKRELDGKVWWEKKWRQKDFSYFPRYAGEGDSFYYSTKAMRRLGYPPIMSQQQWDRLFNKEGL